MDKDKKDLEFMPLGNSNIFSLYVFCMKNKIHRGFLLKLLRILQKKDSCLLVYYKKKIVGHLVVTFKGIDPDAVVYKKKAYMSYLFIQEEFRNMGFGRDLIGYMIEFLKIRGYRQVTTLVDQSQENVLKFYEKQNFVCIKNFEDEDFAFCLMFFDLL